MLYEIISLTKDRPDVTLGCYVCAKDPELKISARPAVIVCPGGGYQMLAAREAEPVVRRFFGEGFNTYLLRYTVSGVGGAAANFTPLTDAALAIQYVREHAQEHGTDPHHIYILGFSAGGHLAASAGVLWNHEAVRQALGIDRGLAPEGINRPDGMILCYPVITTGAYTHKGSTERLCGKVDPTEEEKLPFSLERHVDDTTPPAFIWHTAPDTTVPVENSLLMMLSLSAHKIPFEAHVYPFGPHGSALCNEETYSGMPNILIPHADNWSQLAIRWLRLMSKHNP